jgi:hypothetical protein
MDVADGTNEGRRSEQAEPRKTAQPDDGGIRVRERLEPMVPPTCAEPANHPSPSSLRVSSRPTKLGFDQTIFEPLSHGDVYSDLWQVVTQERHDLEVSVLSELCRSCRWDCAAWGDYYR